MNESTPRETSDENEDDPVYREAALWVARLSSSDATDTDREAFEVWRTADPAHAEAYAEMEAWRRTMGRVPDPRRSRRKTPKGLAAIVALGLAGALAYQLGLVDRLRADAWTGVGEIGATTLADGSRIDLNTDTALVLRFTPGERGIELLRGEAVFDVVPDPQRPFVVRGHGVSARAIGTRFFVRAEVATPVGVAQGHVDVATADGRVVIGPGEIASVAAAGPPVAERSDVARTIAWRERKLVASGQPLATVLSELGRYRHGRIQLMDAELGARRFSGTLDLRDTDDALAVLAASMGLRITRLTPLLVLVSRAS